MIVEAGFFYVFSVILLVSGLLTVFARNPVHAVLFLILAFFNAAGLFVMLGAEFISMMLVIVYVGAVAVLFLFVVMMLDIHFDKLKNTFRSHLLLGLIVGGVLLAEMLWMAQGWESSPTAQGAISHPVLTGTNLSNTHSLGQILYTNYAYLFQISGLILLAAMVGAIVLTHRKNLNIRYQRASDQIDRHPRTVLKIKKIATGAGVSVDDV